MKKVYEIFTSHTVEENVRKSAAERLAVMLEGTPLGSLGFCYLSSSYLLSRRVPYLVD